MLIRKIHQLQSAWSKNPPTPVWVDSSWWIFRKGTSQLVDISEEHFEAGVFILGGIENIYYVKIFVFQQKIAWDLM